ncbi:dual OB domain-containing protein [Antarctobacter jejuensis]|uniref:dual OB domain-containing protein n=1 Tax=Antarctobacter jejuensis TaxID=1439938 RepID=UPI003FD37C12
MAVRRIVCLANSKKDYPNRCVAGVEIANDFYNGWLRPVGNRPSHSILLGEQTYADGSHVEPLDVVDIDFGAACPNGYQSENVFITPGLRWTKVGRFSASDVTPLLHDGASPLWPGTQNSSKGLNDELQEASLTEITSSLALIRPESAIVIVAENYHGHPEARVWFQWGGQAHNLKLTDPLAEAEFIRAGFGKHVVQNPTMCISISETITKPNSDVRAAYKLVASMII